MSHEHQNTTPTVEEAESEMGNQIKGN
jgi:hypothetical protein